ncbi:UPF0598 protein CG30010-like isoform X1 [Mizuhopecten yessoensis]|uniref:UPF0598 protein CG30010-like isoform X1 n=1 Tax=Mizuhopecten yessoensis TaxID=6573 RepID=UPI000B457ED4|nr:UPF0598 protein CG30010-like isoform X1 [Mizuhopecten yessoensis]
MSTNIVNLKYGVDVYIIYRVNHLNQKLGNISTSLTTKARYECFAGCFTRSQGFVHAVLFLDDSKMKNFTSCFKEKDFLAFFFKRLRLNESSRYREDFPFLSLCGRERNFIRCDDRPIVYTHIVDTPSPDDHNLLSYGGAGSSLTVQFEPQRICMLPNTGRVYHPAASALGGIGLVKSSIAIEISQNFEFENGENNPPTKFRWKGKTYTLTNELINIMNLNAEEARDLLYQQRDKS